MSLCQGRAFKPEPDAPSPDGGRARQRLLFPDDLDDDSILLSIGTRF